MPPHLTLCLAGGPGRSQHILQIPIPQGHPGFRHYGEPELEKSTSLKAWFLTLFITHRTVHDDRSGKAGSSRTCGGAETHPQTGVREEAEDGRRGPAARVAQGFGENGVRGGETTGSEKASGVCVASAQFRGATAPDLSGTPVDKGKERRSTGYASCGVQPQRCAGASGRHRQVGAEEREPESRGGHGQLRASPAGHPSEAGKGETRSVGWDTSVHSGVSWGGGWPGPENWTRRLYREPSPGAAVGPQPPLRASAQASAAPGRLQDGTCVSGHAGASCTSWRPGSPAPAEPVWGATRAAPALTSRSRACSRASCPGRSRWSPRALCRRRTARTAHARSCR